VLSCRRYDAPWWRPFHDGRARRPRPPRDLRTISDTAKKDEDHDVVVRPLGSPRPHPPPPVPVVVFYTEYTSTVQLGSALVNSSL
jgi:hypothetical protein